MKTQHVRLADIFLVGPLMAWGGYRLIKESPTLGPLLTTFGAATILYNLRNYMDARDGNSIPGGYAAGRSYKSFNRKQLRVGTDVEMEHTDDPLIAREIAMDHLVEDPFYYVKLKRAGL